MPLARFWLARKSAMSAAGKLEASHDKLAAFQSELVPSRRFRFEESRGKLGSLHDELVLFRGKLGLLHPKLAVRRVELAADRCKPGQLVSTLFRFVGSLKRCVAQGWRSFCRLELVCFKLEASRFKLAAARLEFGERRLKLGLPRFGGQFTAFARLCT